ncbi:hypothetical protein AB0A81_26365 [Streptomyces flaveolus]|uniref:Uncharacterized protein n=1 Tax=Streptomyces flaveolus TaxID=67297 RepID=A0ABV1VBA9_9ACTN
MPEPQPEPVPDTPADDPTHALARACDGCNADPGEPCLPHCLPSQHPEPATDHYVHSTDIVE